MLEWENEVLQQRLARVERERDGLKAGAEAGALEAQRKTGARVRREASAQTTARCFSLALLAPRSQTDP